MFISHFNIGFECGLCKQSFNRAIELGVHIKESHPPEKRVTLQYQPAVEKLPSNEPVKDRFECYICKIELNTRKEIKQHLKQHIAARDNKCRICDEKLTLNELNDHICDEYSSMIHCEYCNDSFNVTVKLQQHLESEHDDRKMYKCRKCPRFFGMKLFRDSHGKRHGSKWKPFVCETCSKTFITKTGLQIHLESHNSESMYRIVNFSLISLHKLK